jgi:hypothetical protein
LRWHLAGVELRRDERDGDVSSPPRRTLDADAIDAVDTEQLDGSNVPRRAVVEARPCDLDTDGVDDPDREVVLMRVDPRHHRCHDEAPPAGSCERFP